MGRRNDRRDRITAAFERLRSRAATALGAAENERDRVHAEFAQQEFALRIANAGVAQAQRKPSAIDGTPDPAFDDALREMLRERDRIYVDWTARGPAQLTDLVTSTATGSAGLPWEKWLGEAGSAEITTPPPELWRIGSAQVPDSPDPRSFPVALPLLDESHLRITTTRNTAETAEALVQDLLLRMLSYYQPGLVRVHVWDIAQLTGTLPGLFPLTRADLLTAHDPTRLDEMLGVLSDHVRRIHNNALDDGHTSLRSLAAENRRPAEPWRVAVLFGNGEPLREEQQHQLQRVARNGVACGVHLIVVDLPFTVNSSLESVTFVDSGLARTSMTGPEATLELDGSPPREKVTQACSVIADEFEKRRARVRTFHDLLPEKEWTDRSAACLRAPVGFDEGEPAQITLGDGSPHALIGGPSGSGKTNFLFGMLGSLAARYSPDELELYLLDFKEGVSFAQFTPGRRDKSWLPHAQLVGVNVNTDREFGLALLRFLADEMRRRADAAKEHEVTKLEDLRAEDPRGRWPRVVAVIDEFQYLFAERDAVSAQAASLLEDVARRGRSQGIHLVLASQDVSGIEAFWGKPAIFEQFILRIALPKARRVLAEQNSAAVELPRWHAVVNHESGVRHGNKVVRIPDATTKDTFDALQQKLWKRCDGDAVPPRLFDGSILPILSTVDDFCQLRPGSGGTTKALLGQVIDVDGTAAATRLSRSPGRNIAVLGSVRVDAASVLGAATLSLARQHDPGRIKFTLAALVDEVHDDVRPVAEALRRAGHDVAVIDLDGIESALASMADDVDARASTSSEIPHCLVLYAADAAHTRLERKDPETRVSGQDHLRKILKQGPELHLHVIGWWRSAQRLKNSLGMGPVDDIGAWVAFDTHGQELSTFAAGQVVNWSPRARRGLFFDRLTHSRPEVILPFELDTPATGATNSGAPTSAGEATGE